MSVTPYGLGRNKQTDPRNANFRAIELLAQPKLPLVSHMWRMESALDQHNLPQCVDYSLETCLMGSPTLVSKPLAPLGAIYRLAQTLDDTPGTNYDGTSVLAGQKAAVKLGLIKEYRWMLTFDDILRMLSHYGPVVMGTNWYENMFYPDSSNTIHIGGDIAGGHAYCLRGIDIENKRVRKQGTWGLSFGDKGNVWISFNDLERLFHEEGESALPVQAKNIPQV